MERRPLLSAVSGLWTEFCDTTTLHGWARLLGKDILRAPEVPHAPEAHAITRALEVPRDPWAHVIPRVPVAVRALGVPLNS